jgi:hypothetical protein
MLNIFRTFIVTTTLAVLASPALAQQPAARVTSTDGRVELTDSRGDVARIIYRVSVGDGPEGSPVSRFRRRQASGVE